MNRSRQNNELIGTSQEFTLGDISQKKWKRTRKPAKEKGGIFQEKRKKARKIENHTGGEKRRRPVERELRKGWERARAGRSVTEGRGEREERK